ncbi:hypothetical protein PFLA_a1727 [Pseudoalteromonas flavipulchra NCIMB 2033 = ATCC BAA-314]|nr:hypothetical protein [Pseudoalteromonas flavipulchra NCIMB 2033 = ATCC BAA-314]
MRPVASAIATEIIEFFIMLPYCLNYVAITLHDFVSQYLVNLV